LHLYYPYVAIDSVDGKFVQEVLLKGRTVIDPPASYEQSKYYLD